MEKQFVSITQGSVGIIEADCISLGLFSDKIQSCRVSVFKCESASLLVHDTSQIRLGDLCKLIAQYGPVNLVVYAVGPSSHEQLHCPRFDAMVETLKISPSVVRVVRTFKETYCVAYEKDMGLLVDSPQSFRLLKDPQGVRREAINILNNWFTPPNSQSVPLDVQYQRGRFTSAPEPNLTVLEMLRDLRDDKQHGLLGASALGYYGPLAELNLPPELKLFLEESGLSAAYIENLPEHLADKGAQYQEVAERFAQLPIF
ncbi:MAG: hypothetical protein EOL92_04980 [Bacteroidia bacterium]|nr:hypothetical protein [Bacteroidia bacterium]